MADPRDPQWTDPAAGWNAGPPEQPPEAEPAAAPEAAPEGMPDAASSAPAPAPAAAARPALSLDDIPAPVRSVFFGSIAIGIIGLIGIFVGAWKADWTGIILILLGVLGPVAIWMGASKGNLGVTLPFHSRYVVLLAGLVATVIGIGGIVEAVFDLDQADESNFLLTLILYVAAAAAGLFVLLATGRAWPGGVGAVAAPVRPGAERGGRLAFLGILLVILGWLLNITIGVWRWEPASVVMFLLLLLAVILLMISEDAFGPRIPVPAAWIAAIVAVWAGVVAIVSHLQGFIGQDSFSPDLKDWLGMAIYIAGIVLAIVGTVMMAMAAGPARGGSEVPPAESPPAA